MKLLDNAIVCFHTPSRQTVICGYVFSPQIGMSSQFVGCFVFQTNDKVQPHPFAI